jgi:hypothetical protein
MTIRRHGLVWIVVLLALVASRLWAYTYAGDTWPGGSVTYKVNATNLDGISSGDVIADFAAAAAVWEASDTSVSLSDGGTTTITAYGRDGTNAIVFVPTANGSGIGGTYWWTSGTTRLESDIVYYDGGIHFYHGSGCTGSYAIYIVDTAVHEMGHMLGLRHSVDTTATMYATTPWCSQNGRTLATDDITGIRFLYPQGVSVPAAPTAPTALLVAGVTSTTISVTWIDSSTGEDGFEVATSTDGTSYSTALALGRDTQAATLTGLAAGTRYYAKVRAVNVTGNSAYSNVVSATTTATVALVLSAAGRTDSKFRYADLSWTGAGGSAVDVYRNNVLVTTVTATHYTDKVRGRGQATTFVYQVCRVNSQTCSNTVTLTF